MNFKLNLKNIFHVIMKTLLNTGIVLINICDSFTQNVTQGIIQLQIKDQKKASILAFCALFHLSKPNISTCRHTVCCNVQRLHSAFQHSLYVFAKILTINTDNTYTYSTLTDWTLQWTWHFSLSQVGIEFLYTVILVRLTPV